MFKRLFIALLIISSGLTVAHHFALAQEKLELIYFWGDGCPHCAKESVFLGELEKKYPELEIKKYEVWYNAENQKLLQDAYRKYGLTQPGVPLTIIKDKYFLGYQEDQTSGKEIEDYLKSVLSGEAPPSDKNIIRVPILGEINLAKLSLPVLTVILGTLDGFNPCAMWILVIFLSLLLPLKSRKKILLVGGVFIFAEGLLYFLFMSAWLNFFLAVGYLSLIKIGIGIFGIIFGIFRIRDFWNWKPGVCKVTDAKSEGKLVDKMQKVLKSSTLPAIVLGIFALAFGVNMIEFFCSAGFPTMYTKILSLQHVGTLQHYLYLLFYNIFYMLDDIVVFVFAFFTLNRFGFSDKYNRYSTLIAGLLILILGLLLIFKPSLLMFG